jgi:hypothetical protein
MSCKACAKVLEMIKIKKTGTVLDFAYDRIERIITDCTEEDAGTTISLNIDNIISRTEFRTLYPVERDALRDYVGSVADIVEKMQQEVADNTELRAENKVLADFTRWVIENGAWGYNLELDGADIQEKAEELKLIESKPMTREEWESGGAEFYDEEDIGSADWYHFTDILAEGGNDERS